MVEVLPEGTVVVKSNSNPDDAFKDGHRGVIIDSDLIPEEEFNKVIEGIKTDKSISEEMIEKTSRVFYMVIFDGFPAPVFINGGRIRKVEE